MTANMETTRNDLVQSRVSGLVGAISFSIMYVEVREAEIDEETDGAPWIQKRNSQGGVAAESAP